MYFLQISDTHFLEDYGGNQDLFREAFVNITSPLEKLTQISQEVKDIPLDFILHCGDICHSGGKRDYELFREKMAELFPNVPLMVCTGNRDDHGLVEEVFYDKSSETKVNVAETGGILIISFLNANNTPKGALAEETCQEILLEMEKRAEMPTILFAHHHVVAEQFPPMVSVDLPPSFSKIMEKKNLIALLSGHTHHRYQGKVGAVDYFTAPPLSFVAEPCEGGQEVYDVGGYHLFSCDGSGISLVKAGDLGNRRFIGNTV